MELSAFDALHPTSIGFLIAGGMIVVGICLALYAKEVRDYYADYELYEKEAEAKANSEQPNDLPEPTPPESPWQPFPYLVVCAAACIGLIIWGLCGTSMAIMESNYHESRKLIKTAIEMNRDIHPDVRSFSRNWPEMVTTQKREGSISSSQAVITKKFNAASKDIISSPEIYVMINEYMDLCFDKKADLGSLNKMLVHFPVKQKELVTRWRDTAYESNYSKKAICKPDHVFNSLGVFHRLY